MRPTVDDLWRIFSTSDRFKNRVLISILEDNRKYKRYIQPVFGKMPVCKVTPSMIEKLLKQEALRAPVHANRLHSLMKLMFKPALVQSWITSHPMEYVDAPAKEKPRSRILDDSELQCVWSHLGSLDSDMQDVFKLCLYTAQRVGEILSMKWSDVDLVAGTWHQKENKTNVDFLCPLSKSALKVLNDRPKSTDRVFSNCCRNKLYNSRKKLQRLSGVDNFTHHDLRRTARTMLSRCGVSSHIGERCLNHAQGGVAGIYDRYNYLLEKTEAVGKLEVLLNSIIQVEDEGTSESTQVQACSGEGWNEQTSNYSNDSQWGFSQTVSINLKECRLAGVYG